MVSPKANQLAPVYITWKQLKTEVVFSLYTHMTTTKQKNTELKGRPLALSTPRQNKQIHEVWEHLLSFAVPCHQQCRKQCHDMWWATTRACSCQLHTPCCLVCASFYVVPQSSLWASVTFAMHRNSLAITDDTSVVLVSQNSTAEGEPLTNSLCQGESSLTDPA